MLGLRVESVGQWTVLHVSGEVDMATGPQLRQEIQDQIGAGHCQLVVDLDGVDFIDSTGLGVLIGGLKRTRSHGGDLRVCGLSGHVSQVFDLTGLADVLAVIDLSDPIQIEVLP